MIDFEKCKKEIAIKAMEVIYSNDAAPTEFSFGYVDKNNHCKNGLVIKKAAPVIINKLLEKGFSLSMEHDGLHVDNLDMYRG